jgi:hypothetical protein
MVDGEVGWVKPFRAVEGCQYSFPYILFVYPLFLAFSLPDRRWVCFPKHSF